MKIQTPGDPYAGVISSFIQSTFPQATNYNKANVLDLVTKELYGTGQHRVGPIPAPEYQVELRKTVAAYMERGERIPILSPWGSEKPDGSGIDVAELCALKTLHCLNQRVRQFYQPGIHVVIRLEDVSAPHLFYQRQEEARREAALYTQALCNLVYILDLHNFVTAVPESTLVSEKEFNAHADHILPAMHDYLRGDESQLPLLHKMGLHNPIEGVTRDFYVERYAKLYPDAGHDEHVHVMARYFSGSVTRWNLHMTGRLPEWDYHGNLELTFNGIMPGFKPERAARRLAYRTIPEGLTKAHMAPWRGKGYLSIASDGEAVPKMMAFRDVCDTMNPMAVLLENHGKSVQIQTDYVVRS